MVTQAELKAKNTPIDGKRFAFVLQNGATPYTLKYAPDGWEDDEYKLVRDMQYFGVFRKFAVSELKFVKDGRDYLAAVYEADGVNGDCSFTVTETTPSGIPRNRFTGYIDFSTYKITELSVDVQIIDGSFTDLVLSRKNTEVNLLGTVSIDGDTLAPPATEFLIVPEININQVANWAGYDYDTVYNGLHYLFVRLVNSEFTEAKTADTYGEMFFSDAQADYLGSKLNYKIQGVLTGDSPSAEFIWNYYISKWVGATETILYTGVVLFIGDTPINIDISSLLTLDINTGDSLSIRGNITNTSGTGIVQFSNIELKLTKLTNSIPERTIKMFLYHEAFERALQHLTGNTSKFYSNLLGRIEIGYDADGAFGSITSGRYIRNIFGLNSTMPVTLENLYKSIKVIYCAGMGIEAIGGVEKVVIESIEHFFNNTVIVNVSNRIAAETIVKEYYPELAFNQIMCGYNSYDYEALGGIYEYNTANKYSTCIKPVEKKLEIISPYRADLSIYIKLTTEPEENRDIQGESDIIIIDTIKDGIDYVARTSEGFTQAEAESNTDVLLNLMLTPARIIRRWGSFLRGFLEKYLTSELVWQTSDKNTKLKSTETGGSEIIENASILVSTLANPLWHPEVFTLEVPALENDIELIKDNPYGLIQITGTEYGWILDYKSKNENGKSEFILLRCNTDYVTPGGSPVYPASITINKTITGFPEDLETKFKVTILSSGGGSYYDLTITQGVPLVLTNVPYGDYIVTETFIPEGYVLSSITGGTFTIDKDNLHFVVDIVNIKYDSVMYGGLYNNMAVRDAREITASGYSVATKTDFETLQTYLGGAAISGGKLKEAGLTYWNNPNTGATNDFLFNFKGNGQRSGLDGTFDSLKNNGFVWTDVYAGYGGNYYQFYCSYNSAASVSNGVKPEKYGLGLRIIKDIPTAADLLKTDGQPCDPYIDPSGYVYETVKIGTQVFVRSNVKTKHYRNGESIAIVTDNSEWSALTTGAMCYYNNDINNA